MTNAKFSEGNSFHIVIAPVVISSLQILTGRSLMSHPNKLFPSSLKEIALNSGDTQEALASLLASDRQTTSMLTSRKL